MKKLTACILVAIFAVFLVLAILPHRLVASPSAKICFIDDKGQPLRGVRVERIWETSDLQMGRETVVSDNGGKVDFKRIEFGGTNWLNSITKCLRAFMSGSGVPDWEPYANTGFIIYWPGHYSQHYSLQLDKLDWKEISRDCYSNRNGVVIDNPIIRLSFGDVNLGIPHKTKNVELTLAVSREERQ